MTEAVRTRLLLAKPGVPPAAVALRGAAAASHAQCPPSPPHPTSPTKQQTNQPHSPYLLHTSLLPCTLTAPLPSTPPPPRKHTHTHTSSPTHPEPTCMRHMTPSSPTTTRRRAILQVVVQQQHAHTETTLGAVWQAAGSRQTQERRQAERGGGRQIGHQNA